MNITLAPIDIVGICAGSVAILCIVAMWLTDSRMWLRVASSSGNDEDLARGASEDEEYAKDSVSDAEPGAEGGQLPVISVIAFSNGDTDEIGDWLACMAKQSYRSIEVMVVIVGTKRQVDYLAEKYDCYPWAHFTFIPPDNHNISLRKLAYTLGVKGTGGSIIVTTDVYCRPASEFWIAEIARRFTRAGCEIVLGYSWIDFSAISNPLLRFWCSMDMFVNSMRWMASAVAGKPYRGDGANLAFLRTAFERIGGYQSTCFMHPGHDDIFVNQIADRNNCETAFGPDARVRIETGRDAYRRWVDKRETSSFTARYLPRGPRVKDAIYYTSFFLSLCGIIAAMLLLLPAWVISAAIIGVLWLSGMLLTAIAYNKAARKYPDSAPARGILFYSLLRPVVALVFNICYHSRKKRNFTWQK